MDALTPGLLHAGRRPVSRAGVLLPHRSHMDGDAVNQNLSPGARPTLASIKTSVDAEGAEVEKRRISCDCNFVAAVGNLSIQVRHTASCIYNMHLFNSRAATTAFFFARLQANPLFLPAPPPPPPPHRPTPPPPPHRSTTLRTSARRS